MYIYKAAVIGAGTMGAGIAQVISYSGIPVVIKDIDEKAVNKGLQTVRGIYESRVAKGKITSHEMEQKMILVTGTTSYEDIKDADIIIEAVPEHMDLKKKVFTALDSICPEHTIFASNTSALSISEMASSVKRPDKVIGLHFFNPAHVMKLIEIIPGIQTSEETKDTATSFAESLRKIPIKVNECAGFLVNRLLMPYINESFYALQEGAGTPQRIDEEMVKFGMPMGSLTLVDMLGIDVCKEVAEILYDSYGDRMPPARLIIELEKKGRLGKKSGSGIYPYDGSDMNELNSLIQIVQKDTGITNSELTAERLIMPMINEAIIAFQEGVSTANDIDIAMMAGTGFPQDKGGPLHWADQAGLDFILDKLLELKGKYGNRFWPAPMLKRYVKAGLLGKKTKRGFFEY